MIRSGNSMMVCQKNMWNSRCHVWLPGVKVYHMARYYRCIWLWRYTTLPSWEHLCSQNKRRIIRHRWCVYYSKKKHRENQQPKVSPVYGCWLILIFPTFLKGPLSIFNHQWNGCCPPIGKPWDFRTWKSKDVAHSPANCYRKPWFLLTQSWKNNHLIIYPDVSFTMPEQMSI